MTSHFNSWNLTSQFFSWLMSISFLITCYHTLFGCHGCRSQGQDQRRYFHQRKREVLDLRGQIECWKWTFWVCELGEQREQREQRQTEQRSGHQIYSGVKFIFYPLHFAYSILYCPHPANWEAFVVISQGSMGVYSIGGWTSDGPRLEENRTPYRHK